MLKTIQKRMTVVLIVSMLLLLFTGVSPVSAEDLSDLIAEPEFVPLLAVTLSSGGTTGATSATVTDYVYGNLLVNVTEQEIATPRVGEVAPTAGDNLITDYEPGADITAGVAAGNYLQIYDVEMEEGARIVAFYQAKLITGDIKEEGKADEDLREDLGKAEEVEAFGNRMADAGLMVALGHAYLDENGDTKFTGTNTVTKITSDTAALNGGWYIAEGNINRTGTTYVNGNVHLILADGSSLTVTGGSLDAGINVTGDNRLTIYAQSRGDEMGTLNASNHIFYGAGIGGKDTAPCGTITVNGGRIRARGGYRGAGIGGGYGGSGGNITINDGIVIAASGEESAGIGGGAQGSGGRITINGGIVTTAGGNYGPGIGGGEGGSVGEITINGGTITATGGHYAAGIGGGKESKSGNVIISGGTITATGGEGGPGIGAGAAASDGGNIIIKNGTATVVATGRSGGADVGNGKEGVGTTAIKRGDVAGMDLTYVKLVIQNLSPDNVNKMYFNEQEHEINNEGVTGFFVERSIKSKNISLDPAGTLISINPGDVQNSRITLNANLYAGLVAGFGGALNFPVNTQSRISVPFKDTGRNEYKNDHTKISGNSDFTISMWICPQGNEPYQTLFRQYGDGEDIGHLGLDFRFIKYNDDEGYLYFGFNKRDAGGWQNAFPWGDEASLANITKIPMNQWTHVALTKSGKSVILYANGMKYYEMTLDDLHYIAHAPLKDGNISIGGTPAVDQFFCGRMDEIQFWNTALTPDEIAAWMYRGIDSSHNKYNNLVYYYKLNQISGTAVIDSKGSYDGITVNMIDANWVASDVREWSVNAGETLKGRLVGSYANGSSKDGADWKLIFEIVEQAKKGTATITGDNEFEYCTKDTKQINRDSFTYRVKDPNGRYSNTYTVNIDIIPVPIKYIDENGEAKSIKYNNVTKITRDTAALNDGWYIVEGSILRTDAITVNGDVHLILADGSSLTVNGFFNAGINVSENNSLTIYGQSKGDNAGSLNATGSSSAAGIGGNNGNCGSITINGGRVTAAGGSIGAGIGGGSKGSGGHIAISDGTVTATGGLFGAGIGGGSEGSGGDIAISGGSVTAVGGTYGAGIGGGNRGNGGNVIIGGGTVITVGGTYGAGIGGGSQGNGGTIIVKNHPTVISTGQEGAADIGNGDNGKGTTNIKHDTAGGTDLTYVRLEVQDLPPDNAYKVIFYEEEHEINNTGLTGFFVEKLTENLSIRLEPISELLNVNLGDVQNSKITIKKSDYADPVAGFGNALNFPTNPQSRIDVPTNFDTLIGGNSDFTISMWIFPNENEPYQTLLRQYNTDTRTLGVWLRYIKSDDNEGYLYFGLDSRSSLGGWQWVWDWNNGIPPSNVAKIPIHQWTHIALTKSGKSIILYANGIKYYEMTLDNTHYYTAKPYGGNISIGGTSIDDQFFSGKMDEIQFWNTALTPDEIKAWMYREVDKKHPKFNNLVFYYGLNQNGGTTVIDSKGSYNGTAINMTAANWVTSDIQSWTVEAGSILRGELAGSHGKGSSNDGIDWNLTFEITEQAKKGIATIIGDNKFEYRTKDTEQEGHDSFTYRVKGPDGKYSNTQAVNINIIPILSAGNGNSFGSPSNSQSTNNANGKSETGAAATTAQEGGKTVTTVVIDDKKVEEKLAQKGNNTIFTIPVPSGADVVIGTLNGQTVKNMENKESVLEIKTEKVTYTLPASQININAVSGQIGKQVELKDIAVSVKISEPAEDTVKIVEDTADKNNYQIIVKPIEFEITCSSGSKTVEVSKFSAYVERMIAIPEGVDPSKITTGVILNSDGTFSHVPTVITMIDGKYYAKINSLTNSTYLLIYSPKAFKDIGKHWAEKDVNDMASRLIISGLGNDLFEPERNITRAEFSTVMVRALGLRPEEYKNDFFDVKAGEWYSEYILTLSYYGLVRGYDDGTFKPDGNITRQEAMAILARAMDTTELGEELEIDASNILAAFNDNADVSGWAKDSVSKCVKTGVVTGRDNGRIAPLDNITRAETTIMVRRLLLNSGLINE